MDLCKAAANKGSKQTARAYDTDVLNTRAHASINAPMEESGELPPELGSVSTESVSVESPSDNEASEQASMGKSYYEYDSDMDDF